MTKSKSTIPTWGGKTILAVAGVGAVALAAVFATVAGDAPVRAQQPVYAPVAAPTVPEAYMKLAQ